MLSLLVRSSMLVLAETPRMSVPYIFSLLVSFLYTVDTVEKAS